MSVGCGFFAGGGGYTVEQDRLRIATLSSLIPPFRLPGAEPDSLRAGGPSALKSRLLGGRVI